MRKLTLNERIARLPLSAQELVMDCAELLSVGNKAGALERFKAYVTDNKLTPDEVAAIYSVILVVKLFMQAGYYIDNSHVKRLIKDATGKDYRDYLAPLVREIEEMRESALKGV